MEIVGIIGLLCAIAVMVIGAYKGLGPLPLTIIASLDRKSACRERV